jgi:hypothetical protein
MTGSRRPLVLSALLLGLVGCAQPVETPEQVVARRQADCRQAGFAVDGDAYKLCILLQESNDRLAIVEGRLNMLQNQVLRPLPYPYRGYPYW